MTNITKLLLEFDPEKKNILPALKKMSDTFGYINEKDAQVAADYFSVPLSQIFETASFYDLINVKKMAEISIRVCSSANCAVAKARQVIREIENALKIKAGDENNRRFSLETMSCLGRCGEGPIVVINGEIYTQVTVSSVHQILEKWL